MKATKVAMKDWKPLKVEEIATLELKQNLEQMWKELDKGMHDHSHPCCWHWCEPIC